MSEVFPNLPDMSRNMALAGKIVSSKGMNVRYDEMGYAVEAVNFKHAVFAGTQLGVRAPSIEAVLGGEERSKYTGSAEDLAHFSNQDLERVEGWRQQVLDGEITARQAYAYVEMLREQYGYSGGKDGNEFIQLERSRQPGEVMAEERAARDAQGIVAPSTATILANETSAAASTQSFAVSPQSEIPAQGEVSASVRSSAGQSEASVSDQSPAAQSETERMQDAYQAQLRTQQEQQSLKSALGDARVDAMLKSYGEQKKDELFDALFEEEDKKDEG